MMIRNWRKKEDDVVGRALQKCAKISAELQKELNGPFITVADRYPESVTLFLLSSPPSLVGGLGFSTRIGPGLV